MAVYLARIKELALKAEGIKGTFNAPATNGTESKFLVHNLTLESNFQVEGRPITTTDLSKFPALVGKLPMTIRGQLELRRTNTDVTEDQWMLLFKAGGWKSTLAGGVTLTNSSKHSDHITLSCYAYEGSSGTNSVRFALRGCAVKLGDIASVVGRATMVDFEMMGVYNGLSTAGAVNTVTHEAQRPQTFLNAGFTYNSVGSKISRFSFNMGTDVQERESVNSAEGIDHFVVVDRDPTFEFDPEIEPTGTVNYHGDLLAGTERAIAYTVQAAPAITVSIPKAQITSINHGNRNGLAVYECRGQMNRNSGDDEVSIFCG